MVINDTTTAYSHAILLVTLLQSSISQLIYSLFCIKGHYQKYNLHIYKAIISSEGELINFLRRAMVLIIAGFVFGVLLLPFTYFQLVSQGPR